MPSLLLKRTGVKFTATLLIGGCLIFVGLFNLPWGAVAIAVGVALIAYDLYDRLKASKKTQRKTEAAIDATTQETNGKASLQENLYRMLLLCTSNHLTRQGKNKNYPYLVQTRVSIKVE